MAKRKRVTARGRTAREKAQNVASEHDAAFRKFIHHFALAARWHDKATRLGKLLAKLEERAQAEEAFDAGETHVPFKGTVAP